TTTARMEPVNRLVIRTPRVRSNARRCPRSNIGEPADLACAVPDLVKGNPHVLQDGQVEVRQWRALRVTDISTAFDARGLAANQRDRKVVVEMGIAVADAG